MSKLFAKYLPVEEEIKENDYVFYYDLLNRTESIPYKVLSINKSKLGYIRAECNLRWIEWDTPPLRFKKVALFLCSRDIDCSCPKCGEKENHHGNYDYSKKEAPLTDILCNECGETFEPIKVIGEISSDAGWVTENMEFDENEVKWMWWDIRFPEDPDTFENITEPNPVLAYGEKNLRYCVAIKGQCGHFH